MALHIHTCCNAMVRPFLSGPVCHGYRSSRQRDSVRVAAVATAPPGTNPSAGPPQEIVGISPQLLEAGGLDLSTQDPQSIAGFLNVLDKGFLSVNLQHPGIRVQNIDPPVLTVDNFLPSETCDALRHAAKASGRMKQSGIGGTGDLKDSIRTSNTLAITKEALQDCPDIKQPLQQLLDTAVQLLGSQLDKSAIQSMQFVKPSGPTQLAPELPQVAHYMPGQHFLSHEDSFPAKIALDKGYQRRVTLLVYLNDVPQGGATKFHHLGFGVQPQKGKALLFFPSFSGGQPDARTLHTAEDAAEGCEKWVFQLWVCTGLQRRPPINAAQAAAQQLAAARKGDQNKSKRPNKKKR